jgi:hypothetical protein
VTSASASTSPKLPTPEPSGASADANVSTAFDGQHFGLVTSTTLPTRVSISATDVAGHTRSAVVRTGDVGYFYAYLAAGPAGLYASTSVIRRFTSIPDEVIRIDRVTLKVVARRTLTARGQVVVLDDRVYLLGDSDVQRLDPITLWTVARFVRAHPYDPQVSPGSFWSLTLGAGKLWAAYGDAPHSDVTQLDPRSLTATPGTWPVLPGQGDSLVGTRTGAWLVAQRSVTRLLAGGKLSRPVALTDMSVDAIADGEGVLVLTEADHPLTLVRADGSSETLPLRNAECRQLSADGQAAWMYCGDHDLVRFALPSPQVVSAGAGAAGWRARAPRHSWKALPA